jgi:tRNA-uridine 2-sulfurtransferase
VEHRKKAVLLFSGGLDSLLVAAILKEQGFDVIALNLVTPFHDCKAEAARAAESLGIRFVARAFGEEYFDMVERPRWGRGKAMNPCMDCRIAMLHAAKQVMDEEQALFVATGEVLGQRPSSQKWHQLAIITRESGLSDRLLRPLSALLLPPTRFELEGVVDRSKLYAFSGTYRDNMVRLARHKYHLSNIPEPSAGCMLTEEGSVDRVRQMLAARRGSGEGNPEA